METTSPMTIDQLIDEGISNSYTYQEYKTLVKDLLIEGKSTGHEQSEALTNYSMLNDRRMKRLDKTLKIDESIKEAFSNATTDITWLVLTEGWCGDAAQSLPVINKLSEMNDGIDLRIISRDDHDELMNNFLTNGGKSIPKLIAYNKQNKEVVDSWGPRPSVATKMVNDYKAAHGSLDPQFKEDLQVWYNKDKGVNIAEDLLNLL
ncbi:thioredoxin family protein [Aquimarina sp. 2201CG14-23]|uniref:thioredoxin family protein n=1 Tax=Aquimarina mycalae TaxID=3040073 RepID=UPI00247829F2|nr:thioredoxin family protein [Aquimarina sp. 2201CG14-23]MDH7446039.1 thioredoxin family protein [Aquimarina sp. 2201CG14-23]